MHRTSQPHRVSKQTRELMMVARADSNAYILDNIYIYTQHMCHLRKLAFSTREID